jgi:hypothetical protein
MRLSVGGSRGSGAAFLSAPSRAIDESMGFMGPMGPMRLMRLIYLMGLIRLIRLSDPSIVA